MGQMSGNAKMFPPPVPFGQTPTAPVLQQAQPVQQAPQQQFVSPNATANQAFYGDQSSVAANQGLGNGGDPTSKLQARRPTQVGRYNQFTQE